MSDSAVLSSVAGYRVVRRLGAGARSVVYLGHAGHGADPAAVAIKVFEAPVRAQIERDQSIEQTVRALSALTEDRPGSTPALLDLATLPDGRVALVLEWLGGGSLSHLLRARETIDPGEAVTILAPVVAALGSVHECGFAHSTLCQSSVLFDEAGRPVLCGLGGLRALPPFGLAQAVAIGGPSEAADGPRARLDCVREDYARLTVLLRSVFAHLASDSPVARRAEPIAAWFEVATATIPFEPCLRELERRLFEWAPACPVYLERASEQQRSLLPGRVDARGEAVAGPAGDRRRRRKGGGRLDPLHLPPEVALVAATVLEGNPLATLGKRAHTYAAERMRGKRRPIIAAASVASAFVVLALTLIPQDGPLPPPGGPVPQQSTGGPDGAGSGNPQGQSAPAGARSGSASDPPGAVAAADRAAIEGDDPVMAAPALLRVRAKCLAAASVICLDAADQVGSVALATDGYSVRMAQQGAPAIAETAADSGTASLAERSGDSALVTMTHSPSVPERKPASLLVVKGEAGWRLREIFDQ